MYINDFVIVFKWIDVRAFSEYEYLHEVLCQPEAYNVTSLYCFCHDKYVMSN